MMIQRIRKLLSVLVLTTAFTAAAPALASSYLGLDLGTLSFEAAKGLLRQQGAVFEDNWGYKGYSGDLPMLVAKTKPLGEADIRKKNAAKAGSDL